MTTPTSRPIRLLAGIAACTGLALAACGSDDEGGGGSTEAFCNEIETFAQTPDNGDDANTAALQSLADTAPTEISGDMDILLEVFRDLQDLDLESASEDAIADLESRAAELDEASANIETFAQENCPDLPADIFEG